MLTHIIATLVWVMANLGLLIGLPADVTSTEHVTPTPVTVDDGAVLVASHCEASLDEGLDWWSEGDRKMPEASEIEIIKDGCARLGQTAEVTIWEDGSWEVMGKTDPQKGIWWRGCFGEALCDDRP